MKRLSPRNFWLSALPSSFWLSVLRWSALLSALLPCPLLPETLCLWASSPPVTLPLPLPLPSGTHCPPLRELLWASSPPCPPSVLWPSRPDCLQGPWLAELQLVPRFFDFLFSSFYS